MSGDPAVDARLQDGVLAKRVPGQGLELARDIFTEVTALAPSFAEGWNKRATTNYLLRDLRAAIEDCRRTLELNPSHFGALSGRPKLEYPFSFAQIPSGSFPNSAYFARIMPNDAR